MYVVPLTVSPGALFTVIEPLAYLIVYHCVNTWLAAPTAADGTTEYGERATRADAPVPEDVSVTDATASLPMRPDTVKS
ncbi:unannotated protein [freshwater metagenome]|uniref:Unannotated protein n=1 Tax=freshwater metagenome TaxID=449393 RepID=A0A6J7KCM6_9ZZZZ